MTYRNRSKISGNVFFALFGAVALVGVIGSATMSIMKGPVRSMQAVTKQTVAENAMVAAGRLSIMAASDDCDNDFTNEPVEWLAPGSNPHPAGGGLIPNGIGAAKQDPWGNMYGYCVWDHGSKINDAGCGGTAQRRLAGANAVGPDSTNTVIAIISSGPDRIFQTTCGAHPAYVTKPAGSDDVVMEYTYGEALGLGLWQPKGDDIAEIKRDLEVWKRDLVAGTEKMVFGVDSTSDPNRPSVKVDYIQKLSASVTGVTFLSNMYVDNANVGIGTTAPGGRLHVAGGNAIFSNQLLPALGTAALPAYGFNGDPNTGIYSPAADTVGITTGGANRVTVNATGVGIGSAPSARLTVASAGNALNSFTARFQSSSSLAGAGGILFDQNNANAFKLYTQGTANPSGSLIFDYVNASTGAVSTAGILQLIGDGSVGIGTSPLARFHVSGGNAIFSNQILPALGTAALPAYGFNGDPNTGIYSPAADTIGIATGGANRVTINATGVGVNTAPSHNLTIGGTTRMAHGSSYDVWIQGGAATSGEARNLAMLGVISGDYLSINHSSEYTGGTRIGGPVTLNGGTTVNSGLTVASGGASIAGLLNMNTNFVRGVQSPSQASDATNKSYVDAAISTAGDGKFLPLVGGTMTGLIQPNATNTIDFGATGRRWKDGYFAGTVFGGLFNGSGASLTNLNATNLTAGTVNVARLGTSGTRNSTTYLRGDNTWQPLSAIGNGVYLPLAGGTMTGIIQPNANNTIDFGTTALRWKDGFFAGTVHGAAISGSGSGLTNLNASNLTTGTVPAARMSGSYTGITGVGALAAGSITSTFGNINIGTATFTGNGSGLTNLNATNLATGTVDVARLGASGTRNTTTYLRGDNTWQPISGIVGSYLPLAGGTMTGTINLNGTAGISAFNGDISTSNGTITGSTLTAMNRVTTSEGLVGQPGFTFIGNTNTGMWRPGANQIGFSTAGGNRLTIDNTRSTFTGELVANAALTGTNQQFRVVNGASHAGFIIRNDGTNVAFLLTNSGDRFGSFNALRPITISATNGNVGLGGSALFLNHNGAAQFGSSVYATSFFHTSDRNLKEEITDLADPFALLNGITGKHYKWKDGGEAAYGVIAQDVEAVMPEAVSRNGKGFLTVEYDQLIAPLVEAVKSLKTMFDDLAAKVLQLFDITGKLQQENVQMATDIETLKADNEKLRGEIEEIKKLLQDKK